MQMSTHPALAFRSAMVAMLANRLPAGTIKRVMSFETAQPHHLTTVEELTLHLLAISVCVCVRVVRDESLFFASQHYYV